MARDCTKKAHNLCAKKGGPTLAGALPAPRVSKRRFFIDNLLVRIHFIIVMIRWTGLAPWEFEFPFPGSLAFHRRLLRVHLPPVLHAPRMLPSSFSC